MWFYPAVWVLGKSCVSVHKSGVIYKKSIVYGAPSWSEFYGMQIAFDGGSANRVQEEQGK